MKFPLQPIEIDEQGVKRFVGNSIVRFLLDEGPFDMNSLAMQRFNREDREQFAQLIGYSVSGLSDLDYVSDEAWELADSIAPEIQSNE